MSTRYSDREVLESFAESVEELLDSEFITHVQDGGVVTTLAWSDCQGIVTGRTGPRREAVSVARWKRAGPSQRNRIA